MHDLRASGPFCPSASWCVEWFGLCIMHNQLWNSHRKWWRSRKAANNDKETSAYSIMQLVRYLRTVHNFILGSSSWKPTSWPYLFWGKASRWSFRSTTLTRTIKTADRWGVGYTALLWSRPPNSCATANYLQLHFLSLRHCNISVPQILHNCTNS